MEMKKRVSPSYVFTLKANSAEDMLCLKGVKAAVSSMNKNYQMNGLAYKKRVCLKGRKPFVKKEVINKFTGKKSYVSYTWAGDCVGGIANASEYDVYIYRQSI